MKKTKKSLALSALALVLCASMFVGTTFAWFTDSVTSANNIIASGNLDIELEYWDGDSWEDVEGKSDILTNTLWEPGVTEVAYLRMANAGSLALKYLLGINVVSETAGVNAAGDDFLLSNYIQFGVVAGVNGETGKYATREDAVAAVTSAQKISAGYTDASTLAPTAEIYLALVVYMPTDVGNEANHNGEDVPEINLGINVFATQASFEEDGFGADYDEDAITFVQTAAEAQAALDNAKKGAIIKLAPGVNYGTLYLRPVEGQANTVTDCDYLVYRNEMLRTVEDLTIIGASGATVDAIVTEAGYVKDSGSTGYVVDIKNLVIDSVNFTDDYKNSNTAHTYSAPLFFDLSYINVDGLTVKNCSLVGDNDMLNFVYFYGSGNPSNSTFETAAKNITITGNTIDGIARLCELRQAENVTITNNTIKNTALHGMLLAVDGGTFSGNVTITGNTAEGINNRLVRMSGAGAANVVIKDNTIVNYLGADDDYIKVTDSTGTITNENNVLASIGVKDAAAAQKALDNAAAGTTIQLQPGVDYGTLKFRANPGHGNTTEIDVADAWRYNYVRSIENITIVGAAGAKVDGIVFETGAQPGDCNNRVAVKNLVIDGVEFTDALTVSTAGYNAPIMITTSNADVDGLTVKNCKLIGDNSKLNLLYLYGADGAKNVTLTGNTVDGVARLCEIRGTENVTITGNTIKNTYEHGMLLAGSNYSGNITITDNIADGINDRFVRMAGAGDAVVVIKDNTITNYLGSDADYIKVTDGTNVTIENNTKN